MFHQQSLFVGQICLAASLPVRNRRCIHLAWCLVVTVAAAVCFSNWLVAMGSALRAFVADVLEPGWAGVCALGALDRRRRVLLPPVSFGFTTSVAGAAATTVGVYTTIVGVRNLGG